MAQAWRKQKPVQKAAVREPVLWQTTTAAVNQSTNTNLCPLPPFNMPSGGFRLVTVKKKLF